MMQENTTFWPLICLLWCLLFFLIFSGEPLTVQHICYPKCLHCSMITENIVRVCRFASELILLHQSELMVTPCSVVLGAQMAEREKNITSS